MVTATSNPIEFSLEDSKQATQPYMWRVYTKGRVKELAYSETYTQVQGVNNAVAAVRGGNATYSVFRSTADGMWYFHIKSTNRVDILARSAYKYHTEAAASVDKELIRVNAATAPYYDHTKAGSRAS